MLLGYCWHFPGWGRFLTTYPTGQETNHYAYTQNDPVNHSDPSGALSCKPGQHTITVAGGSQVHGGGELFPHEYKCEYAFLGGAAVGARGGPWSALAGVIGACFGALNPFS